MSLRRLDALLSDCRNWLTEAAMGLWAVGDWVEVVRGRKHKGVIGKVKAHSNKFGPIRIGIQIPGARDLIWIDEKHVEKAKKPADAVEKSHRASKLPKKGDEVKIVGGHDIGLRGKVAWEGEGGRLGLLVPGRRKYLFVNASEVEPADKEIRPPSLKRPKSASGYPSDPRLSVLKDGSRVFVTGGKYVGSSGMVLNYRGVMDIGTDSLGNTVFGNMYSVLLDDPKLKVDIDRKNLSPGSGPKLDPKPNVDKKKSDKQSGKVPVDGNKFDIANMSDKEIIKKALKLLGLPKDLKLSLKAAKVGLQAANDLDIDPRLANSSMADIVAKVSEVAKDPLAAAKVGDSVLIIKHERWGGWPAFVTGVYAREITVDVGAKHDVPIIIERGVKMAEIIDAGDHKKHLNKVLKNLNLNKGDFVKWKSYKRDEMFGTMNSDLAGSVAVIQGVLDGRIYYIPAILVSKHTPKKHVTAREAKAFKKGDQVLIKIGPFKGDKGTVIRANPTVGLMVDLGGGNIGFYEVDEVELVGA